jgi:hypothetical protein
VRGGERVKPRKVVMTIETEEHTIPIKVLRKKENLNFLVADGFFYNRLPLKKVSVKLPIEKVRVKVKGEKEVGR